MPYKRRYGRFKRRRYTTFRRRYGSKRGNLRRFRGGKISRIWKTIASLKRTHPRPEWKYLTLAGTSSLGISSTPVFNAIALMGNGTQNGQRIGNKITVKKIRVWTEYYMDAGETGNYNYLRFGLLIHKQTDGVIPDPADIWDNTIVPYEQGAPRNHEKLRYYTFLKDKKKLLIRNFDAQANPSYYAPFIGGPILVRWSIKCNIPIEYSGTGNLVTDAAKNMIFTYSVSDSLLSPHPTRRYFYSRIYYVDN